MKCDIHKYRIMFNIKKENSDMFKHRGHYAKWNKPVPVTVEQEKYYIISYVCMCVCVCIYKVLMIVKFIEIGCKNGGFHHQGQKKWGVFFKATDLQLCNMKMVLKMDSDT